MKLSFRTRLFAGIAFSLVLVFFIGFSSYYSLLSVESDYQTVSHTEEVIDVLNSLNNNIISSESNQRGYFLRGNQEFYISYVNSLKQTQKVLLDLSQLISDNPIQVKSSEKLEKLIAEKTELMDGLIAYKNNRYSGEVKENELANLSRVKMDQIGSLIYQMKRTEERLLNIRQNKSINGIERSTNIIFYGTILIFLIVAVLFFNILKAFTAQRAARRRIKEINADLELSVKENDAKNWELTGISELNVQLQGELSLENMAQNIIDTITKYVDGKIGAIYLKNEDNEKILEIAGKYALTIENHHLLKFSTSETWISQVIKDKKYTILKGDLNKKFKIQSGFLESNPLESMLIPFYYNKILKGILEIGFTEEISEEKISFIETASQLIGVSINTARARETMLDLFNQTQQQAEELESQQEELRVSNEELLSKTELLQASEEELRVQQEELRQINDELQEKAIMLENNTHEIINARDALAIKMKELEQTSRYKSEFLANMSHELRTPLNSILILARILRENKGERLAEDEVKYANVIFKAGSDLLELINDILDLSKIESGFVELHYEDVLFTELKEDLSQLFDEVAKNKGVNFDVHVAENMPKDFYADKQRTEQILKNLLSNAFKFTSKGGTVSVHISRDPENIKIAVSDTGIGIPPEKQKLIFEAFQQADGSTSREYGGTGLGLSISKELCKMMKAKIDLESTAGKGSTFTLNLPISQESIQNIAVKSDITPEEPVIEKPSQKTAIVEDFKREKPLLLIVEDNEIFSETLNKYASNNGFDTFQVYDGNNIEEIIETHLPDAILLDVMLPGADGWQLLKEIKSNEKIMHIPVHMMSAGDYSNQTAIDAGANSFIKKPSGDAEINRIFTDFLTIEKNGIDRILLIEDNEVQSNAIKILFEEKGIAVEQAFNGKESLEKLENSIFNCIILDLNLPDISGTELLEKIREDINHKETPVIINTAMELDEEKLHHLIKHSNATVLKSVKSSERLIDEVNLFLHKIKENKPLKTVAKTAENLKNKTILLVDDDMRNVFALSAILDQQGLKIEIANDGLEALEKLKEVKQIDLVLMDIMMPRMDGYEAMEKIRVMPQFKDLPIIALTAKAMKEDRDKCMSAGANDYITKPIDLDKLVSLIKVWIS